MPKIIENLREQIIEEARKQLFEQGYGKTTIRSVASACGIGVGTVYNYFPSKDLLISSFMLEDWHECTGRIEALDTGKFDEFFTGINAALSAFVQKYEFLFKDPDASAAFASVFSERHVQLRGRIAQYIRPLCKEAGNNYSDVDVLPNYIAESILLWTMSGTSIDDQLKILRKLLVKI